MTEDAWNKWGAEDERGALNHISTQSILGAAALVKTGQVVNLAQPLSSLTPFPSHRAGIQHFMGRDGGDYAAGARRPSGFQFAEDTVILPLHSGTHIDALCHAWYDDKLYNGFPSTGVRSTTGATRCGIDKMGPIVSRGLLFDMVSLKGRGLADGEVVTRSDLERLAKLGGFEPNVGDVVLIRTGWQEFQARGQVVSFDTEPGLDLPAALWLAECGVSVVGADNFALEVLPFAKGSVFPVHQRLIRDYGIPLLEGLVLKELGETGRTSFMFAATPLPFVGGTGSPVSPIAIL